MKKQVKQWHGKNYYLLGINQYGEKEWLQEGKFDCNWYWGIGYINTFNRRWTDINSHTHFDSLFLKGYNSYEAFEKHYKEHIDIDVWGLLELMQTIYTMREYSDTIYRGGSHFTYNPLKDVIQNDQEYKRINDHVIPSLLNEVYKMLGAE